MSRPLAHRALCAVVLPLAACGISKKVYLEKESELAACRADLSSGEAALEACRRDLESCLAERQALRRAPAADAAGHEALTPAQTDLGLARADLEACRSDREAVKQEIATLKIREAELRARLDAELRAKTVEIENLRARLAVHVVDRILFDSGSADILPTGTAILDKVAAVVASTRDQIRVEGHADDVPISAHLKRKFFSNWELSAARAASVVRYLEHRKGVSPARMEAVGLSFHRPEVANDSFEGRAQNRRVVIVLTAGRGPAAASPPGPP